MEDIEGCVNVDRNEPTVLMYISYFLFFLPFPPVGCPKVNVTFGMEKVPFPWVMYISSMLEFRRF